MQVSYTFAEAELMKAALH